MNVQAEVTGASSDTSLRPNSTLSNETLSEASSYSSSSSSDERESLELEGELEMLREDGLYHQFRTLLSSGKVRRRGQPVEPPTSAGDDSGIKTRSRAPVQLADLFSSDEDDEDFVIKGKGGGGFDPETSPGDPGFVEDMSQDPLEPFLPEDYATPSESSSSDEDLDVVEAEELSDCLKDVEVPLVMRNEAALRFPFLWRTQFKLAEVDEGASNHTDSDPDFEIPEEASSSSSSDEEYDLAREEEDIADMIAHMNLGQNEDEMVGNGIDKASAVFVVDKSPQKEDSKEEEESVVNMPEGVVVFEHVNLAESIISFKEDSYKDEEDPDFEPDESEMDSDTETLSASESESQTET